MGTWTVMKTHKLVNEYLVQKTFNDDDNFYDKLPEEIFVEIKNVIEVESQKKVDEEKLEHSKTQMELDGTKKDLDSSLQKIESIKSQTIMYEVKINKFSKNAAKWIIRILFGFILPILLFAFAIVSFPNHIGNKLVLYGSIFIVLVISVLSGIFGYSVKGFLRRLESFLKNSIRNLILK